MKRRLPPLIALRAFDAAARRLSFSKAADELNVTQGAVSRQIKLLEKYLTKPLFRRLTRRVELTPFGERYFGSTACALNEIEQATNQAFGTNKDLSVSILPTTATLWLLNHLTAFMHEYPNIRIHVSTSMDPVDFHHHGFDAAIRVGKLPGKAYGHLQPQINFKMVDDWNGVVAIKLWDDLITPVCSKQLLANGRPLETLQDLRHYRLIHTTLRPDCWPAWLRAQKAADVRGKDDIEFNHSFMAVQAVREHVGIAAVPTIEINNLEWRDELVFPFKAQVRSAGEYYLLCSEEQSHQHDLRVFAKWLATFN
jgi:LysR family glycine cleavage system transcriptional activator